MIRLVIFAALIALSLLAGACPGPGSNSENANNGPDNNVSAESPVPAETPVDEIAEGKKHYATNCARCHKEDGTGGKTEIEGKKINAEDLTSKHMIEDPDSEYIEVIKEGEANEGMPAFKDVLTEEQIRQVVKYIRKDLQKQ